MAPVMVEKTNGFDRIKEIAVEKAGGFDYMARAYVETGVGKDDYVLVFQKGRHIGISRSWGASTGGVYSIEVGANGLQVTALSYTGAPAAATLVGAAVGIGNRQFLMLTRRGGAIPVLYRGTLSADGKSVAFDTPRHGNPRVNPFAGNAGCGFLYNDTPYFIRNSGGGQAYRVTLEEGGNYTTTVFRIPEIQGFSINNPGGAATLNDRIYLLADQSAAGEGIAELTFTSGLVASYVGYTGRLPLAGGDTRSLMSAGGVLYGWGHRSPYTVYRITPNPTARSIAYSAFGTLPTEIAATALVV